MIKRRPTRQREKERDSTLFVRDETFCGVTKRYLEKHLIQLWQAQSVAVDGGADVVIRCKEYVSRIADKVVAARPLTP